MILYEQIQVDELRARCDKAQYRIWIASPFIGSLKDVQKILGGRWMLPSVDCKVLTDVENGFIRKDTFDEFISKKVSIRSLPSLHAKIYIIDDWCLITSANLTGTAFYYRYEMGIESDCKEVEKIYLKWWNSSNVIETVLQKPSKALLNYQDGHNFTRKFKSKPYKSGKHDRYNALCENYHNFATLYGKLTGRNKDMKSAGYTLYQEVDYFFNFLVHERSENPLSDTPVSSKQREKLIRKYFIEMSDFYSKDPQKWRLDRTKTIQSLLAFEHIDKLTWKEAEEVVRCLHCLLSRTGNISRFLDRKKNSINRIRKLWKMLLHEGEVTSEKVKKVNSNLYGFGYSSIYELIGWFYPDNYPLMNGSSNKCMKYFGFEI